jgi:alpha-1,3-glucosyltransferase
MVGLSVASVALPPPAGLPDLFPVLVSTFSFLHFLGTFIYFNIVQLSTPQGKQKTL